MGVSGVYQVFFFFIIIIMAPTPFSPFSLRRLSLTLMPSVALMECCACFHIGHEDNGHFFQLFTKTLVKLKQSICMDVDGYCSIVWYTHISRKEGVKLKSGLGQQKGYRNGPGLNSIAY